MFFVCNSIPSYNLSFACKSCLRCLVKDLPAINSISHPRKTLDLPPPLKRMYPYTNITLHSFVNSLTYWWFSYWAFNLSILCQFLTIWSNSSSSAIRNYCLSMLMVIFFFYFMLPSPRVSFFVTCQGVTKMMRDYFHLLTQSEGTWVSSEICYKYSRAKALWDPCCK